MLQVRHVCGASTVSELARAAIHAFIRSSTPDAEHIALCAIIEDLRHTVEELTSRLDGLAASLIRDNREQRPRESTNDRELDRSAVNNS